MSISPLAIVVFVAVAIAMKITVLACIAVATFRRAERSPVAGKWRLRPDVAGNTHGSADPSQLTPLASALLSLADRDTSLLEIIPSAETISLRSGDGTVLNFGAASSGIARRLPGGITVHATWRRAGDTLLLESDAGGKGKIVETYDPDGRLSLRASLWVSVPTSQLDRTVIRNYDRC